MKQHEAVIKVMEENGGYATLGYLNQNVLKVENCEWKTKTPFASIRRIVQDERYFFNIRPGLWALKSFKNKLPSHIFAPLDQPDEKQLEYTHSYFQGLLVEIGNLKEYKTFVPKQDKNKIYLNKKLSEITTISDIYEFSYEYIVRKAKTIDVIWFNERSMPTSFFEIEHSTNISDSLLKFVELQDFYTNLWVIADEVRRREFVAKLSLQAFSPIRGRVDFRSYDKVAGLHSHLCALKIIETKL